MTTLEIWFLAVGLAMDCFAVATTSGIILQRVWLRPMFNMAFAFGFFQALMPLIGWAGTNSFSHYLADFDHWIAFGILSFLGGHMVRESFKDEENKHELDPTNFRILLTLAVATSIDALAIGVSFACLGYGSLLEMVSPVSIIGFVSFAFALVGLCIGIRFGRGVARRLRPDLLGGIILIIIGIKILIEHLFFQ